MNRLQNTAILGENYTYSKLSNKKKRIECKKSLKIKLEVYMSSYIFWIQKQPKKPKK